MFEHPEHFNLAHYSFLSDFVLIRLLELLNGDYMQCISVLLRTEFSRILMLGLVNDTIGTLSNDAYNFILIHLFLNILIIY